MKRVLMLLSIVLFIYSPLHAGQGTGLGFILGSPSGVVGTFKTSENTGFHFGVGESLKDSFYLYFDFRIVLYNFPQAQGLSLFAGLGGAFEHYHKDSSDAEKDERRTEVRLPFGIEYRFSQFPVGVFVDVVPSLELITGVDFHMRGGLGARYYF